jgi:colicin import membrane protein
VARLPERRVVEPPQPDPQIAIEKARREREARERAEREKAEREKAEKERAEKLKREEEAREKRLAALAEKQRKDQLERMIGQAGGAPSGTAAQNAGPSASYAGRVIAKVKPKIIKLASVPDSAEAEVEVRAAPDGTIVGRKLVKSSGHRAWDDAVLRAIDSTGTLPRDVDGRVPSPIVLVFNRPND